LYDVILPILPFISPGVSYYILTKTPLPPFRWYCIS
jgi:hypothetical protein